MVYPTLPRKKQQEPIRENNVDLLARFPNKKIQNPTTQDPNSKFHIEQIQNPNPQNIKKNILRGSEMVYPTLPRKKQQEPISENNVDPLAKDPTSRLNNSKLQTQNIQNPIWPKNISLYRTTRIVKIWKHSKVYIGKRKKVYNGTCYHVRPWMGWYLG